MLHRKLTGEPPRSKVPTGTIDTQLHVYLPGYPSSPGAVAIPEGTPGPSEYRQVMKWLGIDRLVITQGNAHQFDNANLVAGLAQMGNIARGVAVVAPDVSDAELDRLATAGVVGARIMDLPGGAVGLDALEPLDARTSAFGWCLAVQFDGANILEHERRLAAIKSRWILDHHAKFLSRPATTADVDAIKRLLDRGNCWFKFAACYESSKDGPPRYEDVAAVAREIAAHAPERIIWGTNWPHNGARRTEDYPDDAALLDRAMSWLPDERARTLALLTNPAELFFKG